MEEFWKLSPRTLNIMFEGYKLRRKIQDEDAWILGGYIFHGVSVAMANAFRKKNQKSKSYFEIVEKPFLSDIEQAGAMSEDEKQKRIDALMASLHIMKDNFELKHGK